LIAYRRLKEDGKVFSIFESKNKKLVKRWKKEHEQLVVLGKKVLAEYVKNDEDKTRMALHSFTHLAMDHLSSEDIEFFRLMHDPSRKDAQTEESIRKFQTTFKDVKNTLMKFLAKYNRPENPLDEEFFDTFSKIMEILGNRIEFEESDLYFRLSLS
jgi:t-SNARE complex subunit (syntaxin)